MGERREQRVPAALPVRVSGKDAAGKPFSQPCCTLNINSRGARLYGVRYTLKEGDMVELLYRRNKVLFTIIWVAEPGSRQEGQIGIFLVDKDKEIWSLDTPPQYGIVDDYVPPSG